MPQSKKRKRESSSSCDFAGVKKMRLCEERKPDGETKFVDGHNSSECKSRTLLEGSHAADLVGHGCRKSREYSNSETPAESSQVLNYDLSERHAGEDNDDDGGHLVYEVGEILQDQYQILSTLGEGTFGKVICCKDLKKSELVALKVVRRIQKYREAAKLEIGILNKLVEKDPDGKNLCVRMSNWFDHLGHMCMSFELLGVSVFDFLRDNQYQPYSMQHVRHIAYQLCKAAQFLHENGLTHTDLKPENILFCNSAYDVSYSAEKNLDYRQVRCSDIRLIDFGSATFEHEHHSTIVSTRHYRAPEIVLELGWSFPCDVWSIGCIMFELYTGHTLFQTHDNVEHLAMMERILRKLPKTMIKKSKKTKYFKGDLLIWDKNSDAGRYVLEHCKPLKSYMRSSEDDDQFLFDLIHKTLNYSVMKRISVRSALNQRFFKHRSLVEQQTRAIP